MLGEPEDLRTVGEALIALADNDEARAELDRALENEDPEAAQRALDGVGPKLDPKKCFTVVFTGLWLAADFEDRWETKEVCWGPFGQRLDEETQATLGEQLPRAPNAEHIIQVLKDLGIIRCSLTLVDKGEQRTLSEFSKIICLK